MKNCSFVTKIFLGDIWDTSDIPKRLYDIWECPDEIIDFQKKFCTSKWAFFSYFLIFSILQYFQKVCLGLEKFQNQKEKCDANLGYRFFLSKTILVLGSEQLKYGTTIWVGVNNVEMTNASVFKECC